MANGHWLDPLARQLLIATGQVSLPPQPLDCAEQSDCEDIEQELLNLKLRQDPDYRLQDAAEARRAAAMGWRLDVNRAGPGDWLRLPGCTVAEVDRLLWLRRNGGQLGGPEDLQRALDLDEERLRCWEPLLEFRWCDAGAAAKSPSDAGAASPPVDLNRACVADLMQGLPGWPRPSIEALVRERRQAPFEDLGDLQSRLNLLPKRVEELIGRVRFARRDGGPTLPPDPSRRRRR